MRTMSAEEKESTILYLDIDTLSFIECNKHSDTSWSSQLNKAHNYEIRRTEHYLVRLTECAGSLN